MDFREMGLEKSDWISVTRNRDHWWTLINIFRISDDGKSSTNPVILRDINLVILIDVSSQVPCPFRVR
jgi:hypothetical protein